MNITIIIPTYNEGENIGNLLDALFAVLKKIAHHNWTVLIVDGKSTDNTATVIDYKMKTNPAIRFISEKEKKGLGNAYLRGINYAIEELAADAFMEFDGDFQHDPADIIKLIDALDKGYQYIIGSRYVPGGTIPREWAWYRRFLSSFGNLIIKYGLWISTKDNTSGFKLTKVKGFEHILPLREGELLSLRHAYKIHFLFAMIDSGAKTAEVPIKFLNRDKGVSKSAIEDISQSLKVVAILSLKKLRRRLGLKRFSRRKNN